MHRDEGKCIVTMGDLKMRGRRFTARGEEFAVPDSEYADDVDFYDENRENLDVILPLATDIFKSWNLFVLCLQLISQFSC